MTKKQYKPTDPLIQWAYFMEEVKPLQTSTCNLFWRSVVLTPIKVCGPVLLIGFFVTMMACIFLNAIFSHAWLATWAPVWMIANPRPLSENELRAQRYLIEGLIALIFVGVIGYWIGLWKALHALCVPVEIEGGFVKKGLCPYDQGRLILTDSGVWECRTCHGFFTPATEVGEDREAEA